jgi:hypothetical protein
MTRHTALHSTYYIAKNALNFGVDRVVDWTDGITTASYGFRSQGWGKRSRSIARPIGDWGKFLTDFPRLDVSIVTSAQGKVVYAGRADACALRLMRTLFPEGYQESYAGRIPLWELPDRAKDWLKNADWVIFKVARKFPWRTDAVYAFENPIKIRQVLPLGTPPEKMLAGGERQDIRRNVHRMLEEQYTSKFSHSLHDFQHFYHDMYLPTLRNRFGDAAEYEPYDGLLQAWMKRGGLLLLMLGDQVVGASLTFMQNRTCFMGDAAILAGDSRLVKRGIYIAFFWYGIQWALSQGAEKINLGPTDAWQSDPVFYAKQRWGAVVVERPLEHRKLLFLSDHLSDLWQERLDRIAFLTCFQGHHLRVCVENPRMPYTSEEQEERKNAAIRSGLDGIQIVKKNGRVNLLASGVSS